MSMHLNFEPRYWYMGFAIRNNHDLLDGYSEDANMGKWSGYIDDGNSYTIHSRHANTLESLKREIRIYHLDRHNGYGERYAARRLEYLRQELQAERMSYGEQVELQNLTDYIKDGDVELLEAAGVPEFCELCGKNPPQRPSNACTACLDNIPF
jgi:hypothetical protein